MQLYIKFIIFTSFSFYYFFLAKTKTYKYLIKRRNDYILLGVQILTATQIQLSTFVRLIATFIKITGYTRNPD